MLLMIGYQSFAAPFDQCGGIGFIGNTWCTSGTTCVKANEFYSQCLPCDIVYCAPGDPTNPTNPSDPNNPNNPTNPPVKFQRETFTGQKLFVVSVNGSAAVKAGVKAGQLLDINVSAEIKGSITSELRNAYKLVCYTGGTCNCTAIDWTVCSTTGCPITGISC